MQQMSWKVFDTCGRQFDASEDNSMQVYNSDHAELRVGQCRGAHGHMSGRNSFAVCRVECGVGSNAASVEFNSV